MPAHCRIADRTRQRRAGVQAYRVAHDHACGLIGVGIHQAEQGLVGSRQVDLLDTGLCQDVQVIEGERLPRLAACLLKPLQFFRPLLGACHDGPVGHRNVLRTMRSVERPAQQRGDHGIALGLLDEALAVAGQMVGEPRRIVERPSRCGSVRRRPAGLGAGVRRPGPLLLAPGIAASDVILAPALDDHRLDVVDAAERLDALEVCAMQPQQFHFRHRLRLSAGPPTDADHARTVLWTMDVARSEGLDELLVLRHVDSSGARTGPSLPLGGRDLASGASR